MAEVQIDIVAVDNFSGVLGNFGNIMTGINSVVQLATQAFNAFVEPVIEFGKEAAFAASRVDELAIVNQILAANAGIATDSIEPLVASIRAQGIEAGVAETLVANMIRANLDLASATELASVAQDAAVISGMNSSETLDSLIYGITTLSPLVLRHAGIVVDLGLAEKEYADAAGKSVLELTSQEKQQIALNAVLTEGEKLTGAYSAAMENAYKQTGSFARYINDAQVAIGEQLKPALDAIVFSLADFLKWIGDAVEEGGALHPVLEDISNFAAGVATGIANSLDILMSYFESGQDLSSIAQSILSSIAQTLQDIDWGIVSDAIISGFNSINWTEAGTGLGEGTDSFAKALGAQLAEVDWGGIVASAVTAGGEFTAGFFAGLFDIDVSDSLDQALDQWGFFFSQLGIHVKNWIAGIGDAITEGWNNYWAYVGYKLTHPFSQAFYDSLDAIKKLFGISSPSTVFFEIGQNIVEGFIQGIQSLIGGAITALLSPFQPILDFLGIDLSNLSGGFSLPYTGSTAGLTGAGTAPAGTATLGSTVTNNYNFYGTVYMSGVGPEGTYDCATPPLMTSAQGSLYAPGY